MKINKTSTIALMILVLIVINILFFAWIDSDLRGPVEWMSYGFEMFAFIIACISVLHISQNNKETYRISTVYLPISYFAVQTVLSIFAIYICIILREAKDIAQNVRDNIIDLSSGTAQDVINSTADIACRKSFFIDHYTEIVLSVYLLVLVYYVITISIHMTANKATAIALETQEKEHSFIRESCAQLQHLSALIDNPEAKKSINYLYEAIRYKANKVTPEGKLVQNEVAAGIKQLMSYVDDSNWEAIHKLSKELCIKVKSI